jgi:tetratricopeptide (TPR) repeat protein
MSSKLAATLYANRAAAHVALSNWEAAVSDAQAAVTLQPSHSKAFHRLATALIALGSFREAMNACRAGAAALAATGDRSNTFQLLIEQARSARAWLCGAQVSV